MVNYLLQFNDISNRERDAFIESSGMLVRKVPNNKKDGIYVVSLKKGGEDSVRASPFVKSLELDLSVKLSAEAFQWGIPRIGADSSTTNTNNLNAINVDVFVLDTGVALHPDLNVVERRNYSRESTSNDRNGHGTAVAGVIGAYANGQYVRGVAPGVRIRSYKVLDRRGSGYLSDITRAVNAVRTWKLNNPTKPAVMNLSLGAYAGTTSYNSLDNAVLAAINSGVVVCIAAGNEGINASLSTPSHVVEALTVGAYDINNVLASWSNYGSVVDLHAPGVAITTLTPGTSLTTISGTSFSSPHVAGCCCLYLHNNQSATPAQVDTYLKTLAVNTNDAAIILNGRPSTTNQSAIGNI